jgi:hypothetical protein
MVPLLEKGLLVVQTTPYPKSGAIFSSFAPEAAQVADTPVHPHHGGAMLFGCG